MRPDVIHCHDWQTGLVPVLLYEQYREVLPYQRVCYTIHNFAHQGISGPQVLAGPQLGQPDYFLDRDRLGDDTYHQAANLMKGGVVYSNFVSTVSPNHAGEARHGDGGFGLGQSLNVHHVKFGGVLNGVDYDVWNPEIDPFIPARYSIGTLDRKYDNKERLRDRFLLRKTWSPIVAYVGRLDQQKGMHLVHHALFYALASGAQFVLLGDAFHHNGIGSHFWHLKNHLNDNPDCHLEIGYSEELAHLIYAGADLLVVPSMFEPCGLAPMIAMRYGTIPVVRAVGGMVDTVFDRDHSRPPTRRAERVCIPPRRQPGHRIRAAPRARTMAGLPRPVPPAHDQRHAGRLLVGPAWTGLPQHLRAHPPQVSRLAGEKSPHRRLIVGDRWRGPSHRRGARAAPRGRSRPVSPRPRAPTVSSSVCAGLRAHVRCGGAAGATGAPLRLPGSFVAGSRTGRWAWAMTLVPGPGPASAATVGISGPMEEDHGDVGGAGGGMAS